MKRFRIALFACIVFMLAALFVYVFRPGGESGVLLLGNIVTVLAGLVAFLALSWFLISSRGLESTKRPKKWLYLTIGIFFWFLGESTWMIYEVVLGLDPYPSIADAFWLIGYIPLIIGLILAIRETKVSLWSSKTPLLAAVAAAITGIFVVYLLRPILVEPEMVLAEKAIGFAYPLLDLVLIVLTATILVFYQKGLLGKPWMFVLSGFVLFAVGDALFTYFDWIEVYSELPYYDLIDLVFLAGYWAIALGAFYKKAIQDTYLEPEEEIQVEEKRIPVGHIV